MTCDGSSEGLFLSLKFDVTVSISNELLRKKKGPTIVEPDKDMFSLVIG